MSTVRKLVYRNRSYRRFREDGRVSRETLRALADLGRMSACSANQQPLKYILSSEPQANARIFPHLRWAKKLAGWAGPEEGERPAAYVVILGDKSIVESFGQDHGIAAQSMMLGAAEQGLGSCMIANIDRPGLRAALDIPERFDLLLVLALGEPAEKVVVDELETGDDPGYWRDREEVHHVPKRRLSEVILSEY